MDNLTFLKLGGSLITDKTSPRTPHLEVIKRLVTEIATVRQANPDLQLVLGHGSGSFGHVPAKKYGTKLGVHTAENWHRFAEVWYEAAALNRIMMDNLHEAGLPGIAFPPSSGVTAQDGQVNYWNLIPTITALENGLLPVVYGDVVFDTVSGGTILSTEDIFTHLARQLHPQRILLVGIDDGVYADYPKCKQLIPKVTPETWMTVASSISGSVATDVTGGMASKVRQMVNLVEEFPEIEILIFSGNEAGNLSAALKGKSLGTQIKSD